MPQTTDERVNLPGSSPAGAVDEHSAAKAVRQMFDDIAPRYDLLNHTLSMNVDRLWWRRTARTFAHVLARADAGIVDLCAGTGDMAVAMRTLGPNSSILALDFSRQMLEYGRAKFQRRNIQAIEANALQMPLSDGSVDLVVSAFGFRNLANYDAGLHEIHRVLKSGGEFGILEFNQPRGMLGKMYGFYFKKVLPRIGTWISGVKGPYEYLPASVGRFPAVPEMIERIQAVGFEKVGWTKYTFGIAGLYRGTKR